MCPMLSLKNGLSGDESCHYYLPIASNDVTTPRKPTSFLSRYMVFQMPQRRLTLLSFSSGRKITTERFTLCLLLLKHLSFISSKLVFPEKS